MEWIMRLPPAALVSLLDKPEGQLNDVEAAVREAIEKTHTPEEIVVLRRGADLDSKLPSANGKAIVKVSKI